MSELATRPVSFRERINIRLLIFLALVGLVIGYPLYLYVDSEISGGIKDAGGGYKEVDLKAMSSFPFDQTNGNDEDIPKKWRDLDGQRIVTSGEMWAPLAAGPAIDHFDLVYSIQKCCFSGPPQIQHFVQSRATKSLLPFIDGLVKVKGVLHVNVKHNEGKIASVYQLDVESVEPIM